MSILQTSPVHTPEQDTIRIPHILAALEKYWMQNPDLRLGEIVSGIASDMNTDAETVEDGVILETLKIQTPEWPS
jgi:uncharacterized protein YihD (DUF1040 family)